MIPLYALDFEEEEGLFSLEYHTLETFGAYRREEQERILFPDLVGQLLSWRNLFCRLCDMVEIFAEDPRSKPHFLRLHPEMPPALCAYVGGDHFMVLQPRRHIPATFLAFE